MSDALHWLLRLDRLHFDDPGVEFGFAREVPAWGWMLIVLAAAGLAWYCYRRLEGPRLARVALGTLRALALVLLAVIIAGPRLLRPNEVEEPDWILVLVDRSASLTVRDVPGPDGARITRDQQLRDALDRSRPVWSKLAADRVVVWLGFDSTAWDLAKPLSAAPASGASPAESGPPPLPDAVGRRTDLNRALDTALKRAAARPLSGVVVLSDGRSIEPPSRAILRRLEAEKIPVFTLALGSDRGVADLAIRHAEAPRTAFVRDTVPVVVELERLGEVGADGASTPPTATVELVDSASAEVLDTREIVFDQPGTSPDQRTATATLVATPRLAGKQNWTVRIKPDPGATGPTDLVDDNNSAEIPVELVDRPLRVLYFDGYPRWEYRYLKNVLVREGSIASAVTLLSSGTRYIQEGTETIDSIPNSPEDWSRWDVLILGDVWPGVFTADQMRQIRERVATAGLGLVWIAGEGAVPDAWRTTPLADLLPFTAPDGIGESRTPSWGEPITMAASPAANSLGVLRLAETEIDGSWWPARLSDPATGWSQLRWAQRIDPAWLKPTTEVLATARPALARSAAPESTDTPLVLSMRYGAGRSIYIGTDEIWRWRYGRGEYFPERFWLQIVRLLGRESVARSGKAAILQALPDRGETDRPVRIEVTLLDQALVDAAPRSLQVRIRDLADTGSGGTELTLVPESATGTAGSGGSSSPPPNRVFAATWIPTRAGRYRVEAVDPILTSAAANSDLSVAVQIWQPDDEMRRPQTDHPLLGSLSTATGGKTLSMDEIRQLPTILPNRRLKLAGEPDVQTLWDTPLALILMVLLLAAEWIGRRILRLA